MFRLILGSSVAPRLAVPLSITQSSSSHFPLSSYFRISQSLLNSCQFSTSSSDPPAPSSSSDAPARGRKRSRTKYTTVPEPVAVAAPEPAVKSFNPSASFPVAQEGEVYIPPDVAEMSPTQRYYQLNKDRVKQRAKDWYMQNKERVKQMRKERELRKKAGILEVQVMQPEKGKVWGWGSETKYKEELVLEYGKMPTVEQIARMFDEEQAKDIVIVDFMALGRNDIAKYGIVCTGMSERHLRRMADYICKTLRQLQIPFVQPRVYGGRYDSWLMLFCGEVVVHLFTAEARDYYDLVSCWTGTDPPELMRELYEETEEERRQRMKKERRFVDRRGIKK